MTRSLTPRLLVALLALAAAPAAQASEIVGRNTYDETLQVNRAGTALVEFRVAGGGLRHVLYWGAVDWTERFQRDYSGGWKSKKANWKRFRNVCGPYTGPPVPLAIATCTMPDGSHWALQRWHRLWANYGGHSGDAELHVSHWKGDVGDLSIHTDWGYHGRWRHLYGTFTYHGKPVFGLDYTPQGVPLDAQGRNIYVDYHADGVWRRENSFLTHKDTGGFCYLFSRHGGRVGNGNLYRATAIGPGVSPIVRTVFAPPGRYSPQADAVANREQRAILKNDPRCKIN